MKRLIGIAALLLVLASSALGQAVPEPQDADVQARVVCGPTPVPVFDTAVRLPDQAAKVISAELRVDRLVRLAAYLDKDVPAARFNMGYWSNRADVNDESFSGCAAGHAVALFAAEGLILQEYLSASTFAPGSCTIAYRGVTGTDACEQFFGIQSADSSYLFGVGAMTAADKVDPKAAAHRIRQVIERETHGRRVAARELAAPVLTTLSRARSSARAVLAQR